MPANKREGNADADSPSVNAMPHRRRSHARLASSLGGRRRLAQHHDRPPSPTAPDGSYSFEGTSNFAGEEVKIVGKGVRTIIPSGRTSAGETVYRFADGSGFTLRFVAARIGGTVHQAGVFLNGTGRYAGIIGSAVGVPESRADANAPGSTDWRGSYELLKE